MRLIGAPFLLTTFNDCVQYVDLWSQGRVLRYNFRWSVVSEARSQAWLMLCRVDLWLDSPHCTSQGHENGLGSCALWDCQHNHEWIYILR
jgi:hypothetical protein